MLRTLTMFAAIALIAIAQPQTAQAVNESPSSHDAARQSIPPRELRAAVRSALQREATSTAEAHDRAVRDLAALFVCLDSECGLVREERLKLREVVRQRLVKVSKRLTRELTHTELRTGGQAASGTRAQWQHVRTPLRSNDGPPAADWLSLAQVFKEAIPAEWQEPAVAAQQFAPQRFAAQQFGPQANRPPLAARPLFAANPPQRDHVQELVELIQT